MQVKTESFNTTQQKEYQIGEFFTIGNSTYKVVEYIPGCCEYCELASSNYLCELSRCASSERVDRKDVFFILYDENTESTEE